MKPKFLSIFFLFVTITLSAQEDDTVKPDISYGIKAGLNSVHNKYATESGDNVQKKSGVYIGGFVNIPTSETFSIQPELIYSSTEFLGQENMNLLHIPVLLNFALADKFTGFIGPEGQILLGLGEVENEDLFNDLMFGFTFGANYQITPNFYIEARPYFAITKFLEDNSGYRKFNTLQIGLAYKF